MEEKKRIPVLETEDSICVIAQKGQKLYNITITRKKYIEEPQQTKSSCFDVAGHLVVLCYADENNMIGTLRAVNITGLDLYTIMCVHWDEAAPKIWKHYKQAKIIGNEALGLKIDFGDKKFEDM